MILLLGVVTSISPFKVKFDGEDIPSSRVYKYLSTYTPIIGDRVIFLQQDNIYVCLGKAI